MIKIIRIINISIPPHEKKILVSQGVAGAATERPLEGVAEDTANAIRDCRGPLQGPRNDNIAPWLKRGEGFPPLYY